MPVSFETIRSHYPTEKLRKDLYASLGGDWPGLVDNPNYLNTCAIRLSIALRESGIDLTGFREAMDGQGRPLLVSVRKMDQLVRARIGQPTWGMSKFAGGDISSDLPLYRGIIGYHVDWDDATGHYDLWTGTGFVGKGKFSDIGQGYDVAIWPLE